MRDRLVDMLQPAFAGTTMITKATRVTCACFAAIKARFALPDFSTSATEAGGVLGTTRMATRTEWGVD